MAKMPLQHDSMAPVANDVPDGGGVGLYFAHPEAKYFQVGKTGQDQMDDCAARKGMEVRDVERWLAPNLNYEPE